MKSGQARVAQVTIDVAALQHNLQRVKFFAPGSKIIAVIKANAYGHGVNTVARALNDADAFALAMLDEALQLRAAGITKPLLVLHGFHAANHLLQLAENNIATVVHNHRQLELIENYRGKSIHVSLKFDTGMHRLGFSPDESTRLIERLRACTSVGSIILMSHFANADEPAHALNREQLASFIAIREATGLECSMANSAALIGIPQSRFEWVRPGIMLYGSSSVTGKNASALGLKPVMSFTAPVIAVKSLRAGDTVGYGSTWVCQQDIRVAYVAAGYADGYPRHARAGTPVIINGQRCSLIGRVSMDSICVELGDASAIPGDSAELWGSQLSVDEIAECAGTISYELLCSAGNAAGLS